MTAEQAIAIGMKIAERHKKCALVLANDYGASTERALEGCVVSLAAEIMVAIQHHCDPADRRQP